MKYYVNQFYGDKLGLPNVYPNMYIGLFTKCKAKGEGNCCGYYGAEYYLDTALLAYYVAEGGIYQPEKRVTDITDCYYRSKKMAIGSHMWTLVIDAETFEEALEKFKNATWRRYQFFDEELTVEQIIDSRVDDGIAHTLVFINDGKITWMYEDEDIDYIDPDILSRIVQDLVISVKGRDELKLEIHI